MSDYTCTIQWQRDAAAFIDNRYSRGHRWLFDGGLEVAASSSPQVVPLPLSVEAAVDPEEAFVASLSSCHMLWFLALAQQRGHVVDSYRDEAVGTLAKDADGKLAMTLVVLRPAVTFSGDAMPTAAQLIALHERAHASCFIANSVKTELRCEPIIAVAQLPASKER